MPGDVDIAVDELRELSLTNYPQVQLTELGKAANAMPAWSPTEWAPGNAFRVAADQCLQRGKEFLTDVQQGFQAFRDGSSKIADAYESYDRSMATTIRDVTTQDPHQPAISDQIRRPNG